jgi:hypothetical protein
MGVIIYNLGTILPVSSNVKPKWNNFIDCYMNIDRHIQFLAKAVQSNP